MDILSPYIVAIVLGWVVAQGAKYVLHAIKHKDLTAFRQLYVSGNMPSAHSATSVALLTLIALRDGVDGAIFAVAALFTAIVMYDAVMVRHSSGTQGLALQALIKEQKSKVKLPRAVKGHTPAEVLVGALLGVLIGSVVFLATK